MHDSWAVDVELQGQRCELVARLSPVGRGDLELAQREFAVIAAAQGRGVPAPRVHGVGQTASGEAYLLMSRATGASNPRPLVRDAAFAGAREAITGQLVDALARVHSIRPEELDAAGMRSPAAGQDPMLSECDHVAQQYQDDLINRHPALEWGLRFVRRQAANLPPASDSPVVVHGDFRIGNVMYDENGLTSVLDWEGMHAGDPAEDLSWFCVRVWRFGRNDREAGGVVTREDWLRAYEARTGQSIDRARFALWEILGNIRWAVITMNQAKTHLDGIVRSQELAAIGRRTADTELEILRLVRQLKEAR